MGDVDFGFFFGHGDRPSRIRSAMGRDAVSFATFFGLMVSSYKAILCLLRRYRLLYHAPSSERLNAFIAGSAAGLCLLIEKNRKRRTAVALYALTRALHLVCVWWYKHWKLARMAEKQIKVADEEGRRDGKSGIEENLTERVMARV